MNRIEFSVEEYRPGWAQWHGVVPIMDGVSLLTRIHDYESARGLDPPGSYGGLEPPNSDKAADWVRVETTDKKFGDTKVDASKEGNTDVIKDIELGGSKTKIEF